MFSRIKTILFLFNKKCIHTHASFLPSSNKNMFRQTFDDDLENIYEIYKEKIYYSSVYDESYIKLGYKKNKILSNIVKKHEKEIKEKRIDVKPFPLALKFMKNNNSSVVKENQINDLENSQINELHNKMKDNLIELTSTEDLLKYDSEIENKNSWLKDYEYCDENDEKGNLEYGTQDPKIPVSKVSCGGCGALLHCADISLPGYLPSEIFKRRTNEELRTIICQRCHFLKNYNTAINVRVTPDDYIKMISTIKDKFALAILLVDLLDLPCSIWPGIKDILGVKRPIFVVGNKVDLLPKDKKGYLNHIKECLIQNITNKGISETNIKHVCLISATTGFGIEELITQLHIKWGTKGDVYLVGCANAGKSSLFNSLLRSDYCKVNASNLIQRATTSPWPGTTLRLLKFPILRPSDKRLYLRTQRIMITRKKISSEENLRAIQAKSTGKIEYATLLGHIGRTFDETEDVSDPFSIKYGTTGEKPLLTLNEKDKDYINSKWCFDTPGVLHTEQIHDLLTTEELLLSIPKQMIQPRTFLFKPNMTLFLAGLGRLDYLTGGSSIRITVYASNSLPILICETSAADEIYNAFLGTEFFVVPFGNEDRLNKWSNLQGSDIIKVKSEGNEDISVCDILLSSTGWIGVNIQKSETIELKAWTPMKRGIAIRKPSLIPYGADLRGPRIRHSLAYKSGNAFVK